MRWFHCLEFPITLKGVRAFSCWHLMAANGVRALLLGAFKIQILCLLFELEINIVTPHYFSSGSQGMRAFSWHRSVRYFTQVTASANCSPEEAFNQLYFVIWSEVMAARTDNTFPIHWLPCHGINI